MARARWNTDGLRHVKAYSNTEDWDELRKLPQLVAYLESKGETWETDLNTELNAAQRARKQPVEDGYAHHVVIGETRARLHMVPFTARAQAHEATHQSILKQMKVGDVEKAQGVPEALAERSNESRERRAALMAHVRAFTNA